ncbi:hypothetical protein NGRA_0619 [Nosema granulosis]|uniref:Uncharacterized protein n=1 Tax=Nosema granulosis TaxID=83296 RepID=A0A9P6GZZ2_9MICR|nr:hypothetical protein NGRA_0619 [Nosema granulosis]
MRNKSMNSTIQQPTTLIKIRKLCRENINENEEEVKIDSGIDFYDFEFNKKDTADLLRGCEKSFEDFTLTDAYKKPKVSSMFDSRPLKGPVLSPKEDLFIHMPIDVSSSVNYLKGSLCDSVQTIKKLSKRPTVADLDIDFVLDNLKFDLRVKEFEITRDYVLVYFFCKADSLSFYKQYFKYLDLSFGSSCDWLSTSVQLTGSLDIEIGNSIVKEQIEVQNTKPCEKKVSEEETYCRKRFLDRIEYFNQLKSCFTKTDLKIMMINLEKGATDFVFSNTKELAVGSKSNKVMQEAIKIMSGEELDRIYDNLEYDIVPISATKHGAYTIQTLLSYSTNSSHRNYISKYFLKEGEFLLAHDIGNYTFQKILSFDSDLVYRFFISNFEDVVKTDLGMKVFKRCIEHLEDQKEELMNKIAEYKVVDYNLYTQLKQITKRM